MTINGETYTCTGATINGEKVEDDPYVVKESDINAAISDVAARTITRYSTSIKSFIRGSVLCKSELPG